MLLGAPGAGKGTQAELLCKRLGIPKISTGDMLRAAIAAGTLVGHQVKDIIAAGQLVPDDLINELVQLRIKQADCAKGYLFDGYPRTLAQAQSLKNSGIVLDAVIEIYVSDDEIISRLAGRRIHAASGRVYHTLYNPPKILDQDDETGEPLIQRDDDKPETVKKRLSVYHAQTEPLIDWYKTLKAQGVIEYFEIEGHGTVQEIFNQIRDKLDPKKKNRG
jgi:adenylate kinase